ncbi:base excision dna repair protein [Stemphylium lycopersici]|uniref:Base excision dna repair protein n=1 Tax=Stemphylium lycopersici TaxID=183478 RepID=A0A364MTU0_STELY|nr:base excision dna repair protein [Stemphylium lycopersici]RAR03417.1 base excision dna repair protein [Stemphylium lycopersici]RAR03541.1 base excision dna repair protein [Stemphylium lycopersici]
MRRSARTAAQTAQRTANVSVKRARSVSTSSEETVTKRPKRQTAVRPATKHADTKTPEPSKQADNSDTSGVGVMQAKEDANAGKKWKAWSDHATSTPYPDFGHPTNRECKVAYDILWDLHNDAVEAEFDDTNTPETIPFVLDAMIVAVLSQATSWSNAKRAMDSMKATYGSVFAYEDIYTGGSEKLQGTIRCGGLHVRKTKIIMSILEQVKQRYGRWSLDHLLEASDEDAMKELMSYKYIGPKSAFVVMGWCLKRNRFTVDTHVYRIAGLWGWRPKEATREKTQLHLDAVIPVELKFKLHFFLIQHGRMCPACRGGSKSSEPCEVQQKMKKQLK